MVRAILFAGLDRQRGSHPPHPQLRPLWQRQTEEPWCWISSPWTHSSNQKRPKALYINIEREREAIDGCDISNSLWVIIGSSPDLVWKDHGLMTIGLSCEIPVGSVSPSKQPAHPLRFTSSGCQCICYCLHEGSISMGLVTKKHHEPKIAKVMYAFCCVHVFFFFQSTLKVDVFSRLCH